MEQLTETTVEALYPHSETRHAPLACIELDRFCEDCAYNLRTLAVYRDEHTGIPVVRCPECGRIQAANDAATAFRPWLNRVTSIVLWTWILSVIAVFGLLAMAEGGLSFGTLDELTAPAGTRMERLSRGTTRIWRGSGPLEVMTAYPDYNLFMAAVLTGSLASAFACGFLAVVVFPHWRRVAYAVVVTGMPVAVGAFVLVGWSYEAPHLLNWGMQYVSLHAAVQMVGGLAGIVLGRPLARLAVRIVFPPGFRPRLAYLWLADGKPLPRP